MYWPHIAQHTSRISEGNELAYHAVLYLGSIGWLLSRHNAYSVDDPPRLLRLDELIVVKHLEPFDACELVGYAVFSRPAEGVTRYHMSIDVFVFLLWPQDDIFSFWTQRDIFSLWRQEDEFSEIQGKLLPEMTTADTAFVGQFSADGPIRGYRVSLSKGRTLSRIQSKVLEMWYSIQRRETIRERANLKVALRDVYPMHRAWSYN